MMEKAYLGDSVYINDLDHVLELTTENGYLATNTIFLEPEVAKQLVDYIERWMKTDSETYPFTKVRNNAG